MDFSKFVPFVVTVAAVGLWTACAVSAPFFFFYHQTNQMGFCGVGCVLWVFGYAIGALWTGDILESDKRPED